MLNDKPTVNLISNVDIYQYILTNLGQDKASAFELFRKKCEDNGLLDRLPQLGNKESYDGINDDCTLLRFLRARQFNVAEAFTQFNAACTTRHANQLVQAYDTVTIEDYEHCRHLLVWPPRQAWTTDILLRHIKTDAQTMSIYNKSRVPATKDPLVPGTASTESPEALVFHESLTRFVLSFCSAIGATTNSDIPVASCLYLVNISGFGLRQAWNLKEYTQDISKLLANNYPEVIEQIFVVGAPSYFSTIWSCIKGWIDPITASKLVFLTGPAVLPTLSDRIDVANIPRSFGGDLDFEPGMLPSLDSELKASLDWLVQPNDTFPTGPLKWVFNEQNRGMVVAVGSMGGNGGLRSKPLAILQRPLCRI